jgi:hypothetical protein
MKTLSGTKKKWLQDENNSNVGYLNILMKYFKKITISILYYLQSECREDVVIVCRSKSLITKEKLSATFYRLNSLNFIGKYHAGLLGCSRPYFLIVFESC